MRNAGQSFSFRTLPTTYGPSGITTTFALLFFPITDLSAEVQNTTENLDAGQKMTGSVTAAFLNQYVYRK